jgi:hypothetical protein
MAQRGPKHGADRSGKPGAGSARPIEAYHEDALRLAPAAFAARHGNAFLIGTAPATDVRETTTTQLQLEGVDHEPSAHTASLATVVYPLRPKDGSPGHLVTLGRDPQHDVVIVDPSISRFHAFGKLTEDGAFLLQDTGSTNGTTVNGASVPARGAGPPARVKPGDDVRLGRAEFTFADAAGVCSFARKAGS